MRQHSWVFDAYIHIEPTTGKVHICATDADGYRVDKHFTEEHLKVLKLWLKDPATWADADRVEFSAPQTLTSYDQESGHLIVKRGDVTRQFDVSDDEAMAKFVRFMKALKPIASIDQPVLPNTLPKPTEEQLARRTIYANVATPEGVKGYRRPKARYNEPSISAARSQELIKEGLANLLGKRKP